MTRLEEHFDQQAQGGNKFNESMFITDSGPFRRHSIDLHNSLRGCELFLSADDIEVDEASW
jgi:hypothetical protein